jgi:hypothetical protein
MRLLREDFIHYHMREGLRDDGWTLVAGQYPNGSDDELRALYVVDPLVARDRSPKPRHHSEDKLVPDLVAHKEGLLLVVEAKPGYDLGDEAKLISMATVRRADFDAALAPLLLEAGILTPPTDLSFVSSLALTDGVKFIRQPNFAYIMISDTGIMTYIKPEESPL